MWRLARRRGRVWAFIFFGVVERLRNQLSRAFADLAGALDRAHAHILAGLSGAFADIFGCANRMQRHQVVAMAAVSFLAFSERLEQPVWPCWNWRLSGKLMRIIVTQARIRLRDNRPSLVGLNRQA